MGFQEHPSWPHVRAALILLHVASMVVLSLPNASAFDSGRWNSDNARDDLRRMAARLSAWGWTTDERGLERTLRTSAEHYLSVQRPLAAPFARYAQLTGSRQDWSMFASPQRHPAELHIDVETLPLGWQPIYRPHDDAHAWYREQLEHNRFRKFLGRFARNFQSHHYDQAAAWLARRAHVDHPRALRIRVRLWRYAALTPEQIRAGLRPAGHYELEHDRGIVVEVRR